MHAYVYTVGNKGEEYRCLVVEEYLGFNKTRKTILRICLEDVIREEGYQAKR